MFACRDRIFKHANFPRTRRILSSFNASIKIPDKLIVASPRQIRNGWRICSVCRLWLPISNTLGHCCAKAGFGFSRAAC